MNDYIKDFLDYLIIDKKYSINTKESYENDLTNFYLFSNKDLEKVLKEDILKYLKNNNIPLQRSPDKETTNEDNS